MTKSEVSLNTLLISFTQERGVPKKAMRTTTKLLETQPYKTSILSKHYSLSFLQHFTNNCNFLFLC